MSDPTFVPMKRNDYRSSRYAEIAHANMNKPVSKLKCPRCEGGNIEEDESDHPGCFSCKDCHEQLMA